MGRERLRDSVSKVQCIVSCGSDDNAVGQSLPFEPYDSIFALRIGSSGVHYVNL